MHLLSLAGGVIVRGVLGHVKPEGAAREQPQEEWQIALARYEFLQSHGCHIERRHVGADVGVPLVGAHHNAAGFGYGEVDARHACIHFLIFFSHVGTHHAV